MVAFPVPLVMKGLMVTFFCVMSLRILIRCHLFWNSYKLLWMMCAKRSFIELTIHKMSFFIAIKEFRYNDVTIMSSNDCTSFATCVTFFITVVRNNDIVFFLVF